MFCREGEIQYSVIYMKNHEDMMLIKLKASPSFVGSVVALLGAGAASRSATSRRAIARLGLAADKADAPATSEEDGDEDWAD